MCANFRKPILLLGWCTWRTAKQPPLWTDLPLEGSLPHTDSGIGEEQVTSALNGSELGTDSSGLGGSSGGPDAMSELLCTLSSEVRKSRESLLESPPGVEVLKPAASISSISQANKGINVKEILKSLVAAPVEGAEAGPEPQPYHPDPALKREAAAMLPMQFHSFDRWAINNSGYIMLIFHVYVLLCFRPTLLTGNIIKIIVKN